MSNVYPNVKFFRVIQNAQNEGEARFFQLGSIAEVDHIDETNFEVKFKDVEHPLPFSCGIAFEALLDYRVYKLKDAVKAFGLPIKVRFLSSGNDKNKLDDELENDLENVGKVTISRKSTCKLEAFASSIDSDALTFPKSPVKCSLISKESKLSVYVAQRILVKDLPFRRMLRHYNSEFHDKYDLKELDKFDKCQYLDRPDGDPTPEIIGFILEAKISDENDTTPGTPVPSAPTAQTCDPSSQNGKESSPKNNKDCEVIDQVTDTGEYHDGILKINEIDDYESPTDDHVYESVSDKDMPCGDHVYESVSDEDMSCDDQYYEPAEPKRTVHTGDNKCVLQ
ncbi:uncharacterized protein LOC114529888 [Dendronephthya gigantea]|uniref:uncharacterized protein LOC114529888 n=1 Tax=Dendronephthya gigantea TaxID=151771 RepID=UPI00106D7A86|nr:uncharacterized protein LOC114529888 [Dendronephthya gigantea]